MKIVKLYADWWGPCRTLEKILKNKNVKYENVNINSMDGEGLVTKYNIKSIPTLLLFDSNNNLVKKLSGFPSEEALNEFLYETY